MPPHASPETAPPVTADGLARGEGDAVGFDIHTSRSLGDTSRAGRVIYAAIYAVFSLTILPISVLGPWLAVVIAWELASSPVIDLAVERLSTDRAISAYGVINFVGSCIFQTIALLALAEGSAVGVAIAATWLSGSFVNQFVYFGGDRRLLWPCLVVGVAVAIVGPFLGHGPSLNAFLISTLLLTSLVAARGYTLDYRAVLRKLADRQVALVDLERKLSVAVEASGDGLFETNVLDDEMLVSPSWLTMLGYKPGEIEVPVRGWRAFLHPDDVAPLEADYQAHFAGLTPHTTSEVRMLCKDGSYKWVLTRGRLVARAADGRAARVVGTTIDLSSYKALEHQLETARDLAEAANKAKSMFVANMSHEIRTPLNGVIGVTGALARTELTPAQREMVALVQSSGQVLDRLLSDVLDQAKIESGAFQLQNAPFDLRPAVETAAELMRARADEKGVAFRVIYGEAATGAFEGDVVRLKQIISNLASNAIKFTERGEVRVMIDVAHSAEAGAPSLLTITVSDSGIGFDAETGARLFSRFAQADGSTSRQFGGTGLGLAISKTLVELMRGEIDAHSEPGVGSTFTVRVPLPRATLPTEAAQESPATRLGRLRILLAEDHPTNQRVVQLILDPHDVELTIVDNGLQAVEIFRPNRFDLILMDMQMPLMDGLAATREIRRREREAGASLTPIAMFTANAMDEHRALAALAGADHHIAKPITPDALMDGIARALAAREDEGPQSTASISLSA